LIDILRTVQVQSRSLPKSDLSFPGHARCGKNQDWRDVRLKNLQLIVDFSLVGNDDSQRVGRLAARDPGFAQLGLRQTEPHVVAFQRGVTDQYSVSQCALTEQMQLVFARGKIDRGKFPRGNFAVDRHGKSRRDERTRLFHRRRKRRPPNVKRPMPNLKSASA
jgi:hypothetical protein